MNMFDFRKSTECLISVAEYVVSCDSNEYESYTTYCDDNSLVHADIRGPEQIKHVYAQALIGLGLEYPIDLGELVECTYGIVGAFTRGGLFKSSRVDKEWCND